MFITASDLDKKTFHELPGGIVCRDVSGRPPIIDAVLTSPAKSFTLPLAGIEFSCMPDSLILDAVACLGLKRLADISQLQMLTFPKVGQTHAPSADDHTFAHTRYEHSLGVAAIMALLLDKTGIDAAQAKIAVLTALVHDAVTPAGGDMMKMVHTNQPDLFDEDLHISRLFDRYPDGWKRLSARHDLPTDARRHIEKTIRSGHGLIGSLMEVADTGCYLALDLKQIRQNLTSLSPPIYAKLVDFAERTKACRLWETIVIENDRAVTTDTDRLEAFLTIRANMWRHLYHEPTSKFLEFLMTEVVFPELFAQGIVDRKRLFLWGDAELNARVATLLGTKNFRRLNFLGTAPEHRSFAHWEEALETENIRYVSGAFTIIRDMRDMKVPCAKTALYRVATSTGPQTFEEAYPERAAVIKQILAPQTDPIHLYWVPKTMPEIRTPFRRAWEKARAKWHRRRG